MPTRGAFAGATNAPSVGVTSGPPVAVTNARRAAATSDRRADATNGRCVAATSAPSAGATSAPSVGVRSGPPVAVTNAQSAGATSGRSVAGKSVLGAAARNDSFEAAMRPLLAARERPARKRMDSVRVAPEPPRERNGPRGGPPTETATPEGPDSAQRTPGRTRRGLAGLPAPPRRRSARRRARAKRPPASAPPRRPAAPTRPSFVRCWGSRSRSASPSSSPAPAWPRDGRSSG